MVTRRISAGRVPGTGAGVQRSHGAAVAHSVLRAVFPLRMRRKVGSPVVRAVNGTTGYTLEQVFHWILSRKFRSTSVSV